MNKPVQTILAATDLSRPAFAAVRRAALVARDHGARLEILHVIANTASAIAWNELRATFGQAEADLRSSIATNIEALTEQVERETGIHAHASVVDGKPYAEIAAHAEVTAADLIVVGAHGENALTTSWLGTTAHRVLRCARRPVLLVKRTPALDGGATAAYERIVVATDFSQDADEAARSARWLFPRSSITVVHAYQAPFESKLSGRIPETALKEMQTRALAEAHRELEAFTRATGLSDAPRIARHGFPAPSIREYAAEASADLIAIGSEDVPRLQVALLGSVSLDIVTRADCDVLLARVPSG